jgi:trypsin
MGPLARLGVPLKGSADGRSGAAPGHRSMLIAMSPNQFRTGTRRVAALVALAVLLGAGLTAATPERRGTGVASAVRREIVGGQGIDIGQVPWMVAIGNPLAFFRPGGELCGGTLVAARKVVTAAHCVFAVRSLPWLLTVTAGRADLRGSGGTRVTVSGVWVHPGFRISLFGGNPVNHNDVAVLTLGGSLPGPVLPIVEQGDRSAYRPGHIAQILGWGNTREGGGGSDTLQLAQVPIRSDEECTAAFPGAFEADGMTCAGYPQGGVDTCQFDSGGPLVAGDRLAGITSWGVGCARPGSPGVYTRLSSYADLVHRQVAG